MLAVEVTRWSEGSPVREGVVSEGVVSEGSPVWEGVVSADSLLAAHTSFASALALVSAAAASETYECRESDSREGGREGVACTENFACHALGRDGL